MQHMYIWYVVYVCVIVYVHCRCRRRFVCLSLDGRRWAVGKQFAIKKERITYNLRNNMEWFFVRSNNSFIRITCVHSITILPLNLFGILYEFGFLLLAFLVLLLLLFSFLGFICALKLAAWSVTDAAPFHAYLFFAARHHFSNRLFYKELQPFPKQYAQNKLTECCSI